MKRQVMTLTVVLMAALAGTALAQTIVPNLEQDGRKGDVARQAKDRAVARFNEMDTDKDGQLSRDEVSKASPYMADNFDKLDKNKDGFLSWEEFVGHNRWSK